MRVLPRSGKNAHRAIVAALLLALVALAGCGSGGSRQSAAQALSSALHPSQPLRSGRLYESFSLAPDTSSAQPVALTVAGPFESSGHGRVPSLDLGVTTTQAGSSSTVGMIVTGGHLYLDVAGTAYSSSPAVYAALARSYAQAASGRHGAPTFNSFGVDPARWLRAPHDAGHATFAGVRVRHVVAQLNVPGFVADLGRVSSKEGALALGRLSGAGTNLSSAQLQTVERSIRHATVDAYIGSDDGILRKLAIGADVAQRGGSAAHLRFVLAYSGVNRPQRIAAPPHPRPLSQLAQELQQAGLSGSGGGGAQVPPPAGPTAPPTHTPTQTRTATRTTRSGALPPSVAGAAPPAYLRCVARAGQDLARRAQCAPLLNG